MKIYMIIMAMLYLITPSMNYAANTPLETFYEQRRIAEEDQARRQEQQQLSTLRDIEIQRKQKQLERENKSSYSERHQLANSPSHEIQQQNWRNKSIPEDLYLKQLAIDKSDCQIQAHNAIQSLRKV